MTDLNINLEGLADFDRALAQLEVKTAGKALTEALHYAAKDVVEEMKRKVPVNEGALKKAIGKRIKLDKKGKYKSSTAILRIGAVRGGKNSAAWRAHFVEFGHFVVSYKFNHADGGRTSGRKREGNGMFAKGQGKRGQKTVHGFQRPRPFIRPAFDNGKEDMLYRFRKRLKENIDKVTSQ